MRIFEFVRSSDNLIAVNIDSARLTRIIHSFQPFQRTLSGELNLGNASRIVARSFRDVHLRDVHLRDVQTS
jgi:hypothetical protein